MGGNSLLTMAPDQGEKPAASHHQTWQSGAHDRTRSTAGKAG
jgi:hypothetical protein